jgi:subtilisin family serine protease
MIWNRRYNRQDRKSTRRTWNTEALETRALLSALASQPAAIPASLPTNVPQYVPDEVLVQFRTDVHTSPLALPQIALPGIQIEAIPTSTGSEPSITSAISRIRLSPGISVEQAIATLASDPRVIVAEPNWIVRSTAASDDPYYTSGSMWGTYSSDSPVAAGPAGTTNQWGTHAEQAWRTNVTGSSSIVVGVIDEGIQITHPDLNDNIWVNLAETPGDGIDNDGNGYIDDINGWDFANNDSNVNDSTSDSHGTHVAGTIGAEGGNGSGVAGVAWDVTIVPLKFMQAGVGTISNAIKAVNYLTDLKTRHGVNVVASNNSWGGGSYSRLLHEAIIRAANAEILFVAAAGNSGTNNDSTIMYPAGYNTTIGTSAMAPAAYDSVISVASLTESGAIASTSNFGAASVDLAAPGNSILSTVPGGYGTKSGTSMATPHVTGTIALFASAQTGRVPAAFIRSAVLATTTPTPALSGKTLTGGRLNTFSALQYNAMIELDKTTYGPSQILNVTVCGTSANQDPTLPDSIAIQIQSTSETTPLTLTLTETGPDTGRFLASLRLSLGAPAQDSFLQVAHGDLITAEIPGYTVSDSAIVDALAPSFSGITSNPAGATTQIAWNTDEIASAVVRFGLAPNQLDRTVTIATAAPNQNTLLHALDAATTHYFQIEATDLYGNIATSEVVSFNTTQPAPILFVDDDQNATLESHFRTALTANSLTFDEWNVSVGARLPLADNLRDYPLVIWNTGGNTTAPDAGLSAPEQTAIAEYLDNGGRIFISGQSILFKSVSDFFLQNYLRISQFVNDVVRTSHTETGVIGSEITAGMAISAANVTGLSGLAVDAVQPMPGANGLLLHGLSNVTPAFTGVSYRGRYSAGGFGLVFSTLPFESLRKTAPAPNNQNEFLRRVVQYLNSNVDHGFQITPPSTHTTSEAGASVTFSIALTTQPSSDVVIPLSSSSTTEGFTSVSSIVFSSTNWNQPQTVTLTGVDDLIDDGDAPWTAILAAAISTDPNYNGLNPADISLVNLDDDTAGIFISALSDSSTAESGTSVTFTIRLDSQPIAPVTLAVGSSDTTEGIVAPASVVFNANNWNQNQTIFVTGVDDTIVDGNVNYSVVIAAAVSSDPLYNGINPTDFELVNTDNDSLSPTKFFVVNDDTIDSTFEYDANGQLNEHYPLTAENSAPRGIATIVTADRIWVLDATRKVSVYTNNGAPLGSWVATFAFSTFDVQGIATDGTHIWIIDRKSSRVYYFANAASRLSGEQAATSSWLLSRANRLPADLVFGTQAGVRYLWVVDDAKVDQVFRYTLLSDNTSLNVNVPVWALHSSNAQPTGIALDPSNGSMDIWISDSGSDRVYRYANGRTLPAPTLTSSFSLATTAGNTNPQGIADPPPPATEASLPDYRFEISSPPQEAQDTPTRKQTETSRLFQRTDATATPPTQTPCDRPAAPQRNQTGKAKMPSISITPPAAHIPEPFSSTPVFNHNHLDLLFTGLADDPLNWVG